MKRQVRAASWGYVLATIEAQKAAARFADQVQEHGWSEEAEALLRDRDAWGAVLTLLEGARPLPLST